MLPISRPEFVEFLRGVPLLTAATIAPDGAPQAALLGAAVSDYLQLVFDTVDTSRKVRNLRHDPRIALVFGKAGGYIFGEHDERTVQYEGIADFPVADELKRAQELYFAAFPEGRERLSWPGITYVRVRPVWIRYSDYNREPIVAELRDDDLLAWLRLPRDGVA
jgi:general stress protein 26